jgi:hypothetical protein
MRALVAALLAASLAAGATGAPRSHAARAEFQRTHPCPANGATRGPCPGWVVDHARPLACGGSDSPGNMQWQTVADGKAKDAVERKPCQLKR